MKNILLFASGSGTNVENIINYFKDSMTVKVEAVFCNNPSAKVIERSKKNNIPTIIFNREEFGNGIVLDKIKRLQPDLIVLAGFLWKIPAEIIHQYPTQIINIHPALLPKYGGKGMYGMNVHEAVLKNKESKTGITIHYVNEHYDEGEYIFQESINVENCITAEEIAAKIHHLDMEYFPNVIDKILNS